MTAKYAKRYAALMIILVLLLFCQCTALAEEENSTTVPEIELDYETLSFEVYHQGYIPYHYCNFEIENAYELNSFYGGEACWELINIEGDAATLSLSIYDDQYDDMCQIKVSEVNGTGTVTADLVCSWGKSRITYPVTATVLEYTDVMPTGLLMDLTTLNVQVGEEFTLPRPTLDQGDDVYPVEERDYSISFNDIWNIHWVDDDYVYRIEEPGVYIMEAIVSGKSNLRSFTQEVVILVADENGNIPESEHNIELWDDSIDLEVFVEGDDWVDIFYTSIRNYDTLQSIYGDTPTWSVERVAGNTVSLETIAYEDGCSLYMAAKPTGVGENKFNLIVTWGNATASIPVTITSIHLNGPVPTGVSGIPTEIVGKVGEPIHFAWPSWEPADALREYEMGHYLGAVEETWNCFEHYETTDGERWYMPLKPGYYIFYSGLSYGNIQREANVAVTILNADGSEPFVPLEFSSSNYTLTAYTGFDAVQWSSGVIGPMIPNVDYTTSITPINGDKYAVLNAYVDSYNSDCFVMFEAIPVSVGTAVYNVTVTDQKGSSATTQLTINVVDGKNLPTELLTEDAYMNVAVGQSTSLDIRTLLPNGSKLPENCYFGAYLVSGEENGVTFQVQNSVISIVGNTSGVYDLCLYVYEDGANNFFVDGVVSVIVGDPLQSLTIELSKHMLETTEGETTALEAVLTPSSSSASILWESSDPDVAQVDQNGQVQAVSAGIAVITASCSEKTSDSCQVIVHSSEVLTLPEDMVSIAAETFDGVAAVEVILPPGLQSIGARSFAGNSQLKLVAIPGANTEIAQDAFADCPNVTFLCGENSSAKEYAQSQGIPFILMD